MAEIIHFTGTVLTGPGSEQHGLWSVDGRLTFRRPAKAPDRILAGWVLPGFVDAHCHIGLGVGGAVDAPTAEEQARTILATDCGSTTTKAILIERQGDEYRLVVRGEAPTTVEAQSILQDAGSRASRSRVSAIARPSGPRQVYPPP